MSKDNFSRRDFVRRSAAGIGGLAIAGRAAHTGLTEMNAGDSGPGKDEAQPADSPVIVREGDVVIENDQVRLVIGPDAVVRSLLFKPAGEECLAGGKNIPISTIIQERPYQNEIKLAYPCQETDFKAISIQRDGDLLTIGYELIPYKATVRINIKPSYIEFRLEDFIIDKGGYGQLITAAPVWKIWFLQLPVRERTYYGDLLEVVWDDKIATNILSTDPYTRIAAEKRENCYILKAGAEKEVKLKGAGAVLITCTTDRLLDNIGKVEDDFDLPPGVKSRRSEAYKYSYYFTGDINPGNMRQHLKYAKMGGFRAMSIYYPAFLKSKGYRLIGDFDWNPAHYPNGKEDLRRLLDQVKGEGIIPGFHFLHTFIGLDSRYVTPVPDHRLNLVKLFTLASPLAKDETTIHVDQDPFAIEMADGRRVLKIGSELITYTGYTDTRPYRITGCVRGAFQTKADHHPAGFMLGVLDVSEFGAQSVYINQDNDLQDEMAEKLADIYQAGFQFCYYDGSEGVNAPFWCNIARAQWRVHKRLDPQPLFAEGAAKTHFSWHMLSRGNAFDIFRPEELKESIKAHPAAEAPRMKQNFTHINFGWLGYWTPDENTVGTQPDMLEYVASRAAAWDCPISIQANLKQFENHPRTPDNFEVMRRWEEARIGGWLTEEQKSALKNLEQEHILLIDEQGKFELQPYSQIENVAGNSRDIRAFIFEKGDRLYVVYWHISGAGKLELPLHSKDVTVMEDLQKSASVKLTRRSGHITIPTGNRRYIRIGGATKEQVKTAFQNARVI
ncbi:MAG: hypothetical protein ABS46_18590 [Cytophagaceae bacterium SCN 52-12]|nr:MAG: hypothetical protein ABS46_18590 [Cytophagaceae bacterium SCN 52-12]